MRNRGKREYASRIIKSEFGDRYSAFNVEQTGTETKNHSFIVSEQETPKYFLKIHGKGKPLKEKIATDFYSSNNVVETPNIWSIGEDYTVTSYEKSLERLDFFEHVESLASFHRRLMDVSHENLDKDLFSHFSDKEFQKLIRHNKEVLENTIDFCDFYSIYSDLNASADPKTLRPILIHGDPHRGNLLKKRRRIFLFRPRAYKIRKANR